MLPKKIRNALFDSISGKTMRPFFNPPTLRQSAGLNRDVLLQSQRDFFINGAISGHGAAPELMAGIWVGGREAALVTDEVEAWIKKAMGAAMSQENQCPYCEDMLLSLTLGAREQKTARAIDTAEGDEIEDPFVRDCIAWARAAARFELGTSGLAPFRADQLPEAIGTLLVFSYTNKISDFLMDGSPVPSKVRSAALRFFGRELRESSAMQLAPGDSLDLLPRAEQAPADLSWATPNLRVHESLSRWVAVVERSIESVLSRKAIAALRSELRDWDGAAPPLSRQWIHESLPGLSGSDRSRAQLALLVAKASYQCDDSIIESLAVDLDEKGLVRLGAFGALEGGRKVASVAAAASADERPVPSARPEASSGAGR